MEDDEDYYKAFCKTVKEAFLRGRSGLGSRDCGVLGLRVQP